ncbi:MAG: hypothetical protein AAGI70_05695 [Pseudomonadota bacterium]
MTEAQTTEQTMLALNTQVEDNFVSPLTAVRGALEILRDFPDLEGPERAKFVERALTECGRLEKGVEELAATVYAAGRRAQAEARGDVSEATFEAHRGRVTLSPETDLAEIDLSGMEFSSSALVGEVYDVIDQVLRQTRQRWWLIANFTECSIWPEAWVAFAHRGKKVAVSFGHAPAVRYSFSDHGGPEAVASREAALEKLAELKSTRR